jgi:hypothetical protein
MEFKFLRFEARDKYNLCRHLGEADFCGQVKAFLLSQNLCQLLSGDDLMGLRVSDYNHQ